MKIILSIYFLSFTVMAAAQQHEKVEPAFKTGSAFSAAVLVPLGEFSATHLAGMAVEYMTSFSKQPGTRNRLAFTCNGGVAYFHGKKETVSGYSYTYPGYYFIHGFAGMVFIASQQVSGRITAGPALGIHDGSTRFNFGSRIEAAYHINQLIALGPLIGLIKEPGADALWSAGIKVLIYPK